MLSTLSANASYFKGKVFETLWEHSLHDFPGHVLLNVELFKASFDKLIKVLICAAFL